jgi:hypothetical protein
MCLWLQHWQRRGWRQAPLGGTGQSPLPVAIQSIDLILNLSFAADVDLQKPACRQQHYDGNYAARLHGLPSSQTSAQRLWC